MRIATGAAGIRRIVVAGISAAPGVMHNSTGCPWIRIRYLKDVPARAITDEDHIALLEVGAGRDVDIGRCLRPIRRLNIQAGAGAAAQDQ